MATIQVSELWAVATIIVVDPANGHYRFECTCGMHGGIVFTIDAAVNVADIHLNGKCLLKNQMPADLDLQPCWKTEALLIHKEHRYSDKDRRQWRCEGFLGVVTQYSDALSGNALYGKRVQAVDSEVLAQHLPVTIDGYSVDGDIQCSCGDEGCELYLSDAESL